MLVEQWRDLNNRAYVASIAAASLALIGSAPDLKFGVPEIVAEVAFVEATTQTSEGQLISAVTPVRPRSEEMPSTPTRLCAGAAPAGGFIAGAYGQAGWVVTLTPRGAGHHCHAPRCSEPSTCSIRLRGMRRDTW